MQKNIAGQKWRVFAFDRTTNEPTTGDAANITAQLSKDFGTETAVADTNPTEVGGGYYDFDLAQAETNADTIMLRPASSTTNISVVPCPVTIDTVADSGDSGDGAYTGTLTVNDGTNALEGVVVNALRGGVLKASGTTNSSGQITDWVFGAYTYDLAARLDGYQPATDTLAVSANAWTKTISLSAISITAPSSPSLCTVQFRIMLSGTAVEGAVCKAKLIGINQASDGIVLSNAESSDTTDSQGIAELQLVQASSIVKGSGTYRIWVEISGKPVASVSTRIPSQSTVLFEDLLV